MDDTGKPAWTFSILLISLVTDAANMFRLIHGPVPWPFLGSWVVAAVAALLLGFGRVRSRAVRIIGWIVLSLAVWLLSILSDGTNLSLWVWLSIILGPVTPMLGRRFLAGLFGLIHLAGQAFLLPLPIRDAPISYGIIQLTGALGFLMWHQWHRPAAAINPTPRHPLTPIIKDIKQKRQ